MAVITDDGAKNEMWECAIGAGPVAGYQLIQHSNNKVYLRRLMPTLTDLLAAEMHRRADSHDLDSVIVIDGEPGSGKSSLAVALARAYCGSDWDMSESYVYNAKDFMDVLSGAPSTVRGRLFWLDEASNLLNARNSMTVQGRAFSNIFDLIRAYNLAVICCIPWYSTLDRTLRETGRVAYRLHTGPATFSGKEYRIGTYELQQPIGDRFRSIAYGTFPAMDPQTDAIYRKTKDANLERRLKEIQENVAGESATSYRTKMREANDANRAAQLRLYELTGDYSQIMDVFGVTYDQARQNVMKAKRARGNRDEKKQIAHD